MSGRMIRPGTGSVRTKILSIFLALSVVSLLICSLVALVTISDIGVSAEEDSVLLGTQAVSDASGALVNVTESNMILLATGQADLTDVVFEDTVTEMELIAVQAESLTNNPPIRPVTGVLPQEGNPASAKDASVIFLTPGGAATRDDAEYQALCGMSDLLRGVRQSDANLSSVYIVTDSGIVLKYPWQNFSSGLIDLRNRPWFTGAKKTSGVFWSKPYMDFAGHGLVVTGARAVNTKYGTWVIGCDVTVDAINAGLLNRTLGGRGYAVLMDNQGNVLSRPGLSSGLDPVMGTYIPENVFLSQDAALIGIGQNMTAGKTGIELTSFGGVPTYVAYAPVKTQNWSYAVSRPADEITAPVRSTQEKILSKTRTTSARIGSQTNRFLDIFAALIFFVICLVALLAFYLARIITRPVELLKTGAQEIGSGNLDHRVNLVSGDEFEELAGSFNRMAGDLKSNIEKLRETTAEKERYAKELEIAKEIQDSFLPESIPEIAGYDIAAAMIPAMEIGGDLYDILPLRDGTWGFVVADVSGKSVSAALYMALSHKLFHAGAERCPDPGSEIRWVNRMLYDDSRSGMFVTVLYGVLDPAGHTFNYVNAGHASPLILRKSGGRGEFLEDHDIALGVLPEIAAEPVSLALAPGDILFLYTDGVTEAFNDADECFGEKRLAEFLEQNRARSSREILEGILEEIRSFREKAPQSDDITILVIRVE